MIRNEQYGVCEISNHFINEKFEIKSNHNIYEYKNPTLKSSSFTMINIGITTQKDIHIKSQ